ncbi:squalene/phytoene synthase family protein [Paenisporosarcina cavernae]|uniref:Phytoene/squalene synthase family protein n=1 Tax=Paenisporosarcina cavernae TaxID=2320858 RepID=A0A385YPI0_9BACL|nr:squalene/phytoene synthase family protein [Paenisporosarcina cavernae]AYC28615.1 phytoene/squalene synthase family protein [Paenisporosarcina cavernae]
MHSTKNQTKHVMNMLKETSRTFYLPISFLSADLKSTVAAAYLCMRAIDEIEDHPALGNDVKKSLLTSVSQNLAGDFDANQYAKDLAGYESVLPEVTWKLADWIDYCPEKVRRKVQDSTSEMAFGMAKWAERNWRVDTKEDLDEYTYYVAGLVGVMLSDLWESYGHEKTDREKSIAFGRGLQLVNILRNQQEDAERGVSYVPNGWMRDDLFTYADENLSRAKDYVHDIQDKRIKMFCKIPYALAERTLAAMKKGQEKMSRTEVEDVVAALEKETL